MAVGLEKMTEWALLTFQARQSLRPVLNSSHHQEQELKEEILGDAEASSDP